jgi:hypothetical protein
MEKTNSLQSSHLTNISVDGVIFGFQQNQLKVLLLRFKNANV